MTRVIALKPHRYGTQRVIGEKYEVRKQDERLVFALGWVAHAPAEYFVPEPEPPKRAYMRKDIFAVPEVVAPTPSQESATAAEPDADERPKRTYRRRDLTAET